jgi:hypothetical protein
MADEKIFAEKLPMIKVKKTHERPTRNSSPTATGNKCAPFQKFSESSNRPNNLKKQKT